MEAIAGEAKTTSYDTTLLIRIMKITLFTAAFVVVPCFFLYNSAAFSFQFPPISSQGKEAYKLEKVLKNASMGEKTVIITTVNEAWAANNSLLDLFIESFRIGINTQRLLNHLVIITMDQKAYARCISIHPHCYALKTRNKNFSKAAFFMTPDYMEMMWTRIGFLNSVLKMGYSFVFTAQKTESYFFNSDTDIMWFRDPFPHFYPNGDFQIACDRFNGNSKDINNWPNGGFMYVKSNNQAKIFYQFWYSSRLKYPGINDQDILNMIKHDPLINKIGLTMRFLDTAYIGGFCERSKDLNRVCTMHANCCAGLGNKIHDLGIMLDDWRRYKSFTANNKSKSSSWTVPQKCSLKTLHKHGSRP